MMTIQQALASADGVANDVADAAPRVGNARGRLVLLRRVLGDREALRCALVTPQAQSHTALLQKAQHTKLSR